MATASELASRSLKLIIVEAADAPLESDEYSDYYFALNSFMSDLEARGISLGYTPVTLGTDEVTVPPGALRGIISNLALEVAPDYGASPNPILVLQAREGMRALRRIGQAQIEASYPPTLPRGTGHDNYPWQNLSHYREMPRGAMTFAGNSKVTVISAINTPVKVKGDWAVRGLEVLLGDVTGRILNPNDELYRIAVEVNFTATAPSSVSGIFSIRRNGAVVEASTTVALNTTRASGIVSANLDLKPGEYLEFFVENATDDVDITVADAIFEVA